MRRTLFLSLGILELLVALVLFAFAWQLPGPAEVRDTVGRVERVSRKASGEVARLHGQMRLMRERQPQLKALSQQLRRQLGLVQDNVRSQQIDYQTVRAVRDALGDTAAGLDGLSATLDPKGLAQIGAGLKETADFLDTKVAPGAEEAAERLEKTTAAVRADSLRLAALLKQAPLDLRAAKAASASLGEFDEGLERMLAALKMDNYTAIRDGFQGLETSLKGGAAQVDRLAAVRYPAIKADGLRLDIEQRDLWPEARETAEGMRKAAKGVTAANKELAKIYKELPRLRASLAASRKLVGTTRQALNMALKQQEKLEPLLKSVPLSAARMAEQLPRIGDDLAKVLRETAKLKELAALLRRAQKGVETASANWPELRKNLGRSAVLLRATRKQLSIALANRKEYEAAARQTLVLTETFADALPLLTDQLEEHVRQQEESLAELSAGLDSVADAMPAASQAASRLLVTTRLLLALAAAVVALHGAYLALGAYLGSSYSA
jgi:uncharacterized phage infection (PIP) family protein YhgE